MQRMRCLVMDRDHPLDPPLATFTADELLEKVAAFGRACYDTGFQDKDSFGFGYEPGLLSREATASLEQIKKFFEAKGAG